MDLYYGKPDGNKIILDEDESNHLIKVKRARIGETVNVTDGEGHLFTGRFDNHDKRHCVIEIQNVTTQSKKDYRLHIAIAPTKNIDRIEWFLEKATEIGIDEITFLLCRHSERKEIKEERLNKVLISAMKQSMKTFLPKLNPMLEFKSFFTSNHSGAKLICTMSAGKDQGYKNNYHRGKDLIALIGPEGDFHDEEIALARQNNFHLTSLGDSRLRTETAAVVVCTLFNFINSK